MGKINVLDEHIANQIAAGEVVERPASVVKELVENSIDANSTRIDVIIIDGGLTQIKVKDNGDGLEEDDVERAFLRHATSKIKTTKDLFKITSLGFRGEALPSIAAVSRVILKTSNQMNGHGLEIKLEGGTLRSRKEVAHNKGTEIIVEDIFFNTPARLKYMKSLQTELGHIIDYMNRLSLSYPKIAFSLSHNNRQILSTNGDGEFLHVISAVYGTAVAKNMVKLENEDIDFKLVGYLSKPEITRANKSHLSLFINGRFIKNFLITQAILRGYKTLLMVNRFPIGILDIQMDPSLVDVNVHPAKLEARFSKEQELLQFIETTVYQALNEKVFIREPIKQNSVEKNAVNSTQPTFDLKLEFKEKPVDRFMEQRIGDSDKLWDEMNSESIDKNENPLDKIEVETKDIEGGMDQPLPVEALPLLDPIAQIKGTYIVAQSEKGLYLIDQHAAHERIQYEKNINLLKEELITSQELLIPLTIDFSRLEAELLKDHLDQLLKFGVTMEQFGQQTFIVRSIPQWIPTDKEKEFIEKISHKIMNSEVIDMVNLRNDLIASVSCKSAIKANKYLTKREMEMLLEQLRVTKNPYSCPHGRPTIIHFSFKDIEKMFKRVV